MKLKKRNKRTRARGSRSGGWGFRKKHKGHGNAGGHGWSGTGKRGSQKQQKALMLARNLGFKTYFGRRGMTSAPTAKKRTEQINLQDIKSNFFQKENQKIELKNHKILGEGNGFKAEIFALSASKSAIEKMDKAGGKIILPEIKENKKEISKSEKKVAVTPLGAPTLKGAKKETETKTLDKK
jgi:large subunit ribosomal protein L15